MLHESVNHCFTSVLLPVLSLAWTHWNTYTVCYTATFQQLLQQ